MTHPNSIPRWLSGVDVASQIWNTDINPRGGPTRQGFTAEQVRAVLESGDRLPMPELLRCRVRYFSDGLALGSAAFVETVFQRYRGQFGPHRQEGLRPMRYGRWDGLCTLRDLRLTPVVRN